MLNTILEPAPFGTVASKSANLAYNGTNCVSGKGSPSDEHQLPFEIDPAVQLKLRGAFSCNRTQSPTPGIC